MIYSSRFLLFYVFFLMSLLISAQNNLKIEIINLKSNKGFVLLELLDESNQSVTGAKVDIKNNACVILFENIKSGTYAVKYFHDENSNDVLDSNWMGIPKEGYGISNNAYGMFGPKDFKLWLFEVSSDINIKLTPKY
jgi:uncharacterized protein (DUF2141 family)